MPETPLEPTRVSDVLLRQGEFFSKRGKRGFLAASTVMLVAAIVIIYFTVFPIPRLGPRAQPARTGPRLNQSAVAVTSAFTKLGWNEHKCRAASHYSVVSNNCPSRVLPTGAYTFVLNTWQIEPHCFGPAPARAVSALGGHRLSAGCITYTAANGETISYTMARLPQGWRVVGAHAHHGAPIPNAGGAHITGGAHKTGGAHITAITGPTTTTIAHPQIGAIIRCEANGSRLRATIPASGEVKKSIEGSTGGSTGSISLALIRRPDGSVVVSCRR